ncbi:MAG: hypothetical protein NZ853_09800 [Leptospiraceae bacterium]|nr:hypothetical protein [Leptospiraceae bacterium]MDW7976989.1 hypothetical protein [Leptospiraceae bacterium]
MKLLKWFYFYFFLFIALILVFFSFFPILMKFTIPTALILILMELIRLKLIKNAFKWIFRREEKHWNVGASKILLFSFLSIMINLILYLTLKLISEFFYIQPLKRELERFIAMYSMYSM